MNHLIVRADATAKIGTGHIMRCLALAQAWQNIAGDVTFLTFLDSPRLADLLISEGMSVKCLSGEPGSIDDIYQVSALAEKVKASWIVVDGYQFDAFYQRTLKNNGLKVLFLDDYGHADHYYADLILNQNLYADEALYTNRESATQVLLGYHYVLLRRHFEKWRKWHRKIPEVARKVLITLGGSDSCNVTAKVIQLFNELASHDLELRIVVGSNNPHLKMLNEILVQSTLDAQILSSVTDMSELMAWADIAISGGGSTCWEIAFMGLPNCIIILAHNQVKVAEILDYLGVSINMGQFDAMKHPDMIQTISDLIHNKCLRRKMSILGKSFIFELGAKNVVQKMLLT